MGYHAKPLNYFLSHYIFFWTSLIFDWFLCSHEVTWPCPHSAATRRATSVVAQSHFWVCCFTKILFFYQIIIDHLCSWWCISPQVICGSFVWWMMRQLVNIYLAKVHIPYICLTMSDATCWQSLHLALFWLTPCQRASCANFIIEVVALCFAKLPPEICGSCLLPTPRHTCG